ncbi:MAG: hypothetical protein LUD50_01815 [Clostridia bacterium]|nr:hypothetical protein [Clostridia bacterium]
MRVLSKAFIMKDSFNEDRFFGILSNWLKRDGSLRAFGEALEGEDRARLSLSGSGCSFETLHAVKDGKAYAAARCTQDFGGAVRTTDSILEQAQDGAMKVFLHISVSADTMDAASCASDFVRMFAASKHTEKGMIPLSDRPVEACEEAEDWFIPAVSGQYTDDVSVVVISETFSAGGFEADAAALARALGGIACVACAGKDYTWKMRKRGYILPYNGAAAIYMNGARRALYRTDALEGEPLTDRLIRDTLRLTTLAELPSWDYVSAIEEHPSVPQDKDMNELLEDAFSANTQLEKEVQDLREQVSLLSMENSRLLSRASRWKPAASSGDCIIHKGDVPEFYDAEQYDMIISILQNALAGCTGDTRQKELLEQVLARNPIRGNGKVIFDTVKRVFTEGRRLTARDASDLRRIGISIVSDNKHYKLIFKDNSRYMFSLSKTPSDSVCSGRNMASEIISKLSVYKKA